MKTKKYPRGGKKQKVHAFTKFLLIEVKENLATNHSRITLDQLDFMSLVKNHAAGKTEQHLILTISI